MHLLGWASHIHHDHYDVLLVSCWEMVKLAMLLLVCLYIHVEIAIFGKKCFLTIMLSLMSRYPFMCCLCLGGFIMFRPCFGYHALVIWGQRPFCHCECLAHDAPLEGAWLFCVKRHLLYHCKICLIKNDTFVVFWDVYHVLVLKLI